MRHFSIDTAFLDVWQAWDSNLLLALTGILLPLFGLLGRQGKNLELVRGQTLAVLVV